MKKLIFIIFFLLAILYGGEIYGAETNETLKEQEEAFGISSFIKEAENYTEDNLSDIDLNSVYKSAISGNIDTHSIFDIVLRIAGKEVVSTLRILGYILVIIVLHSIIKSISEGMGNRRNWRNYLLCSIHINCNLSNDKFF